MKPRTEANKSLDRLNYAPIYSVDDDRFGNGLPHSLPPLGLTNNAADPKRLASSFHQAGSEDDIYHAWSSRIRIGLSPAAAHQTSVCRLSYRALGQMLSQRGRWPTQARFWLEWGSALSFRRALGTETLSAIRTEPFRHLLLLSAPAVVSLPGSEGHLRGCPGAHAPRLWVARLWIRGGWPTLSPGVGEGWDERPSCCLRVLRVNSCQPNLPKAPKRFAPETGIAP